MKNTKYLDEDFYEKDEPAGVSAAGAPMAGIPALELPTTLGNDHFQTMFRLFDHDLTIKEGQITSLFEALGSRFEVQRKPNIKIIDMMAANALSVLAQDPKTACANADPRHASYDLLGAKPRLLREALGLLTAAGLTREELQSVYDMAGSGGGAASSSSSAPYYVPGQEYAGAGGLFPRNGKTARK
jgi:hypothetical protein